MRPGFRNHPEKRFPPLESSLCACAAAASPQRRGGSAPAGWAQGFGGGQPLAEGGTSPGERGPGAFTAFAGTGHKLGGIE